ncbi:MAG: PfkB family carbohydrate kinase [Candidatus Nitrosocaldaceae archaeon]
MKIGVASHTAIDNIVNNDLERISIGGPTYYAGLMIKELNLKPVLITKVGYDFPFEMDKYNMIERSYAVASPTTRFKLVIQGYKRRLFLLARCEDLSSNDIIDLDGYVISPITNEISNEMVRDIIKHSNFIFLDPQGFVRRFKDKECYIARTDLLTDNIDVIKVDEEEAYALTGLYGLDAVRSLKSKIIILTTKDSTRMVYNDKLYIIRFNPIDSIDSTGIGDIFAATYTCSYMKDKDPVWALSLAVASSIASLKKNNFGIDKIPDSRTVEKEGERIFKSIEVKAF